MSVEKSIALPATPLTSVRGGTAPTKSRQRNNGMLKNWLRQYGVSFLAAADVHLAVAYWPAGSSTAEDSEHRTPSPTQAVDVMRFQMETLTSLSAAMPAVDSASQDREAPTESPSLAPPSLDEPFAELVAALRSDMSEFAESHSKAGRLNPGVPILSWNTGSFSSTRDASSRTAMLYAPQPLYPPAARQAGREGVVELSVTLMSTGVVRSVTVTRSSGYADLDHAASDTVLKAWRFRAGLKGAELTQYARITFRLTETEKQR